MKKMITLGMLSVLLTACGNQSDNKDSGVPANEFHNSGNSQPRMLQADAVADSNNMVSKNPLQMTVYKSPTCGCCAAWVTYLEEEGFSVTSVNSDDMDSIKAKFGLPSSKLASCHTALVGDYLIEGHVPASDIKNLLAEKPKGIKGLTAPGMPALSPGMGSREPQDYDVLSFTPAGETAVYSSY